MELGRAVIAVLCVLVALSVAEETLSKRDKKKTKSKSSNKKVTWAFPMHLHEMVKGRQYSAYTVYT